MRTYLIVVWLFIGLSGLIYHYGPGKEQVKLDGIDQRLASVRDLEEAELWREATDALDDALAELPADRPELAQRLRLEKAKAQMMAKQLPEAHQALKGLLIDLTEDADTNSSPPDEQLIAETREALASSQYYITWLMRLEGASRDEWEPEIESARQNYRLLAEQAQELSRVEPASRYRENLESAVRLARMDLGELQGLPLPSQ